MSEMQHIEHSETQTPLDDILGHDAVQASIPAESAQESEAAPVESGAEELVSLNALRSERERRKQGDKRVRELEDEIARFKEQGWGLEEQADGDEQLRVEADAGAQAYKTSFENFKAKHGQARVDAIDAAAKKMSPEQRERVLQLASRSDADPVESVLQYVEFLGLLEEFKPTTIQDALSGKSPDEAKQPDTRNDLSQREQALVTLERRTAFNASRSDFVSEYGKDVYTQLDEATAAFANSGHPLAQQFIQDVGSHPDPVGFSAGVLLQLGWRPNVNQQTPQRAATAMPSSFTNVRNVGARSGPAFAGPTPLGDIFKRSA